VKFATVLVRTLKPGKTYDDFVAAWYPDRGLGVAGQGPILRDEFDFSTDATVASPRPSGLDR
jgi:hypothetical protein